MCVNLSMRQLQDPDVVDKVERALRRAALDPNRLQLEITESAVMKDAAYAQRILAGLAGLAGRAGGIAVKATAEPPPFTNEPTLELRRASARDSLLEALRELGATVIANVWGDAEDAYADELVALPGIGEWTASYIALAGYACIIVNFAVVNVFFVGQHSYSGL